MQWNTRNLRAGDVRAICGHVQWRPPEAPVNSGILRGFDNAKRGRRRPKLTWEEAVKRDMKDWNVPRDLVFDRAA